MSRPICLRYTWTGTSLAADGLTHGAGFGFALPSARTSQRASPDSLTCHRRSLAAVIKGKPVWEYSLMDVAGTKLQSEDVYLIEQGLADRGQA
jgi:hypothetical protein